MKTDMETPDKPVELMVVMPVYNEQASIRKVVREWFEEISNWTSRFVFLVIDDGSKDDSLVVLSELQQQFGSRLEIITRDNRGHGQTCLQGYRLACERQVPFVLQLDSDGQCDPQYFFRFWRLRDRHDVIYGRRARRDDGMRRILASLVLKIVLVLETQTWCVDANVPYRMMRTSVLPPILARISESFFLANVALAVLLRRTPGIRQAVIPIRFRERYGGEPSVQLSKFGSKASELIGQLRALLKK